jgi:transcription initiation factor TFIID TATA-box-binding protein
MEPIVVKNVVATFNLRRRPFTPEEYYAIAKHSPNSEYNPRKFHAIVQRIRFVEGRSATGLIFRSTKVVLTGAGSCCADATQIAQHLCRRIDAALHHMPGHQMQRCRVFRLQVRNIVGSVRLPFRVPGHICVQHKNKWDNDEYKWALIFDTTVFPALRCRVTEKNGEKKIATILAFHNGKIIVTGVRTVEMLEIIYEKFHSFVSAIHNH